ncbi:hypothetical protein PTKIN_Ptkin14bG0149500 [Pterospermum kingtungense]
MIKHCAGLPLAIIVVGGILATKSSLNEWRIVYENIKSYLKKGTGQEIEEVLALSYDDLRPCFLYLSRFPEDYEINANRLIQLWAADGFVSSKQDEENGAEIIEDAAEGEDVTGGALPSAVYEGIEDGSFSTVKMLLIWFQHVVKLES